MGYVPKSYELISLLFHREADFSGIRIDEIVKNKQPMEQITVRQMEVSNNITKFS